MIDANNSEPYWLILSVVIESIHTPTYGLQKQKRHLEIG